MQEELVNHVRTRRSQQHTRKKIMKSGSAAAGGVLHPVLRRSLTNAASTPRKSSGSSSPERGGGGGVLIGPGPLIRLCLHAVACIASLVIGFRFSRETLLVLVIKQPGLAILKAPQQHLQQQPRELIDVGIKFPYVEPGLGVRDGVQDGGGRLPEVRTKSGRVHVGRHEILIRPWPHPDSAEIYRAHALLERVQVEQQSLYGPKERKTVIAITPTFARTFQAIHLLGVMHTLRAAPGPVIWIVVEAGGRSNETASILASSRLEFVHLGVKDAMPVAWEQRRRMETRLRIEGLSHVRREKLDGLILFADDSNVHSLQLFDEIQKVKWIGALSVGLLETGSGATETASSMVAAASSAKPRLPVQGPACNETCHVVGWHVLRPSPVDGEDDSSSSSFTDVAGGLTDVATHLEWSGFVINSRAVWDEAESENEEEEASSSTMEDEQQEEDATRRKPEWINEWKEWISEDSGSPLRLAKDQGFIEALGNCGREVMLWWIRVEARADSRYPPRWSLTSPLEITVPAQRTPWPEFVETESTGGAGSASRKMDPSEKRARSKAARRAKRQRDSKVGVDGDGGGGGGGGSGGGGHQKLS
ncbi:probable beta-1,4-xylosyltransferase IRX14 isoform X2 [Selaginella moellendorffii]|uniref:probable beta-1,4-xylosyltransferase IRX14 isoform X2 n=1 Tax=Selaginella moellendorffii TaxID=88036 RepID=UPI000D1C9DE2|nr:probable beta-1,4-xylosyltransferase IRX14 isoform X2 [Selaginella moellendorffii]|eukprot:XP_024541395.1 probable beta-1,4-xylosyltransferase IRX14 isoform X2 [Selaginella moellendorffii]